MAEMAARPLLEGGFTPLGGAHAQEDFGSALFRTQRGTAFGATEPARPIRDAVDGRLRHSQPLVSDQRDAMSAAGRAAEGRSDMPDYNVFRTREIGFYCAVPEDRPVPAF